MARPNLPSSAAWLASALALAAAGCDPQAPAEGYAGEPVFEVRGQVTTTLTSSLPPVEVALLWSHGVPTAAGVLTLAERAALDDPAGGTFTLTVYAPPPAEAHRALAGGEPRLARGQISALPRGFSGGAAPDLPTTGNPWYGVDVEHWLLHLEGDALPGSVTAWWLGAPLPAGFHLVRVLPRDCPTAEELAACVATLTDLGVPSGEGTGGADAPSAEALCGAAYRLEPGPAGEQVTVALGTAAGEGPAGSCP